MPFQLSCSFVAQNLENRTDAETIVNGATWNVFDPITYIGNSHYWVCDGVSEYEQRISFLIELINTSNYTYYNNPYIYNPGNLFSNHMSQVNYLSMKWGWRYGSCYGWYIIGDVNTPNGNYQYDIQDYVISKP